MSLRSLAGVIIMLAILVLVTTLWLSQPKRIWCDRFGYPVDGDYFASPLVLATPAPGWTDLGTGCYREP
jgi:hypothetical protein